MFTGLIEEIGVIKNISKGIKSAQITIAAELVLEDAKVGDSICTNGICLTISHMSKNDFTVDVMPQTMRNTNLNNLSSGSHVNLERALQISSRFGGHIVSGHIDGIGTIVDFRKEDNATWITVHVPEHILKYIVEKGSITIDGTSLTVASVGENHFKVSIIPLTADKTILLRKRIGDVVNLECDVVGKYIERFMILNNKKPMDLEFLKENGFY